MSAAACDHYFLMERSVVGLLRLATRLMRREDMSPIVSVKTRLFISINFIHLLNNLDLRFVDSV